MKNLSIFCVAWLSFFLTSSVSALPSCNDVRGDIHDLISRNLKARGIQAGGGYMGVKEIARNSRLGWVKCASGFDGSYFGGAMDAYGMRKSISFIARIVVRISKTDKGFIIETERFNISRR